MDNLIATAGVIASVLGVVGALPQLRRTARTRDVAGLSLTTVACSAVSDLAWIAYSLAVDLAISAGAAAALALVELTLAALLAAGLGWPPRPLLIAIVWGAALTTVTVAGGWPAMGLMLPLSYGARMAPAVWVAWRTHLPTGISRSCWLVLLAESGLWAVYGVAHHDRAITLYAGFGLLAGLAVSARLTVAAERIGRARAGTAGVAKGELMTLET
ncbi:MAG: PQ-loop repeat-containing protein [Acidimicrobiales bacterium]